jgi:ubiquinone/menaquinone biosynthesis C-methylase UbiE
MQATQPSIKPYKGMGMEGSVARWYAKNTAKDMDRFRDAARLALENTPEGGAVLEVAPGPGYLAIELAKSGRCRVAGLDISKTFVEIARQNAAEASVEADFRQGDAAYMPFADGSFDFIICTAAFKNFGDPVGALNEMWRVLRPDGKAMIIDLRRDVRMEPINQYVNGLNLGKWDALMTKLTFRFMLIKRAYTRKEFETFAGQTKFKDCRIKETLIGFEILLEK